MAKDEKTSGKVRFKEQCYLLWNLGSFVEVNKSTRYDNLAIVEGEPTEVINTLISSPGLERLFQLKPFENSSLTPLIKLFKTTYGNSEKTEEIKFRSVLSKESIDQITSTRFGRGDGIGIKSVTYDLQGGSETGGAALVKKGVTAVEVTFVFQNLEMLVQRDGNGPALIDLVTFPPASSQKSAPKCAEGSSIDFTNVFDAAKFAIKLVYGYAVPNNSIIDQDLKDIIDISRTTLLLNLQRHELDFKQDGTIELKCQYMGYTDAMMNRPEADILFINENRDPNINEKVRDVDSVKLELDQAKEDKKAGVSENLPEDDIGEIDDQIADLSEELKDLQKAQKERGEQDRVFAYQRFLNEIYNSGKVYFVELDEDQVEQHLKEISAEEAAEATISAQNSGITEKPVDNSVDISSKANATPAAVAIAQQEKQEGKVSKLPMLPDPQKAGIDDLKEGIEDATSEDDLDKFQEELGDIVKANASTKRKNPGDVRINYVYYGDLLDVAFAVLKKNPEADTLRPMVGPIAYNDPKSGQSTIANLADIPISLNKFLEWFNKNVVAQSRQEYLLEDFVRDTIKDLIHAALGENCFPGTGYPSPEPSVTIASIPLAKTGGESIIPIGPRTNIKQIKSPGPIHYKDANKIDQYAYIYAYTFGMSNLTGDRDKDHAKGIYHLQVGADRGLVKQVSFSRIDDPKLAASRATSVKCDLRHLRENYKVNVTMIGNSLFKPGQTIYINPSLAGGSDPQLTANVADALGLGGYYTVTKVSGDVGENGFNTEIEAYWSAPATSRDAGIQTLKSSSPSKGGFGGTGDGEKGASNPTEPEVDDVPTIMAPDKFSALI